MLTKYTKMQTADNKMYPFINKMHTSPVHLAFSSFGKDSMATLILALDHKEPLDAVVTVREYYDRKRGIQLEHPIHTAWIENTAIPWIESNGVPVVVIESQEDFLSLFYRPIIRGQYVGMHRGYPLGNRCYITRDLKMTPIHDYLSNIPNPIQYVGICADENVRLARLNGYNKISLLAKYGITQSQAKTMCEERELLSPLYQHAPRTGCWLCPNQSPKQTKFIHDTMPELFEEWFNLGTQDKYARYKDIFPKYTNMQVLIKHNWL